MDPELLEALNININEYTELQEKGELTEGVTAEIKQRCISLIDSRLVELEADNRIGTDEYNECTLVSRALKNGWLVSDIPMFGSIYKAVKSLKYQSRDRLDGKQIISQLENTVTDTVADRFSTLKLLMNYMIEQSTETPEAKKAYGLIWQRYRAKAIYATEYPNDANFGSYSADAGRRIKTSITDIVREQDKFRDHTEYQNKKARESDKYILAETSQYERKKEREQGFIPNDGQKHNNIKKSNRDVISEVFGSDVYDEIDEMRSGTAEERTVTLYHSTGSKYQAQGHEVLEIEFAGSGAQDVIKYHKGRNGEIKDNAGPEEYEKRYGKKVKKGRDKNGNELYFDYIHSTEREYKVNDELSVKKKRYAIAGASPNMGKISGLFNLGEYSIESSGSHARDFAKEFIEPLFERFKNGEEPRDINIILSGHSRGAVAAGESVKKINEWVQKYVTDHPECKPFADCVKYDLTLYDPVAGAITDLRLGVCDLRGIKNVNTTVICTMAQDHYDALLPLQHVKGAKKIVLTTTDHLMDIWKVDESQINVLGDGKKHAQGYYDAETGEMYRGSGISQMPDGVYISDEKHNMVRITSYSQLSKVFKSLYGDESPQRKRCNNIHKMVRDWFIENQLEMSFPDDETRQELTEKNTGIEERILDSPNKRLNAVKHEIETLRQMKAGKAAKDEIIEQHKAMIRVCREYMKKTRIPAAGDSLYRVDLVSDLLSFTMRETNELEKELALERGENKNNALNDRIEKHRTRLDLKQGYTGRKLYDEKNRLADETAILESVMETAKLCEKKLEILDKTREGRISSDEYDDFRAVLEEGSRLGGKTSVSEANEFYRRLTAAADRYTYFHDTLIGPLTKDGQTRLKISKEFSEHGKTYGRKIEDKSIHLRDKDMPMEKRILKRKQAVERLSIKSSEQREKNRKERKQEVEDARKKLSV